MRVLARSRLLQLKQIFPGSHRAIWAWFPLGLNPLSMFQIIYRESIESYTVMNSLLMAFSLSLHLYESQSTKVLLQFHLTPLLCFKSQCLIWFKVLESKQFCDSNQCEAWCLWVWCTELWCHITSFKEIYLTHTFKWSVECALVVICSTSGSAETLSLSRTIFQCVEFFSWQDGWCFIIGSSKELSKI